MIDCASYRRYNGLHDDDLDQLHSHVDSSILDGLWSINPGADDDDEDELTHTPPMIRSLKRMVADARRQVKKSRSEGSTSKGKRFLNHLDLQVPIVSTTDALTKAFSLGQSLTEQQCMLSSPMVFGIDDVTVCGHRLFPQINRNTSDMEIIPIIANSTVLFGGSRNPSGGVATGTTLLRSIRDRGSLKNLSQE
jgi:hypothetical protein